MIGTWVASVLSVLLAITVTPGGKPVWKNYRVESSSMASALRSGDIILVIREWLAAH